MEEGGEYIHGTDSDEQQRLSLLNDLMNDTSLAAMELKGGERVLDVGSGLGQLTSQIARAIGPDGRVVGIERDDTQLSTARENVKVAGTDERIDFRQGEAVDFPLSDGEWGSFDLVHARFLLEHVPDPQAVVNSMVRAAKPGGRIVLEDDDHDLLRLWPEPDGVYDVWRAYIESYKKLGNDPFVGRQLISLLHNAGAEPLRNDWHFFGSCSGSTTFRGFVENFVGVVEGARKTVIELTSMTEERYDAAIEEFQKWGGRSDAALWYCTFWAQGRRPPE